MHDQFLLPVTENLDLGLALRILIRSKRTWFTVLRAGQNMEENIIFVYVVRRRINEKKKQLLFRILKKKWNDRHKYTVTKNIIL